MIKLGYLGPDGTFTHKAATIYSEKIAKNQCQLIEYPTIMDLIYGVHQQNIDKAVVPIENSLEGSVNVTIDMLANEVDCCISGEFVLQIRHHLLALNVLPLQDIRIVLSHPQALAQCRLFINKNLNNPVVEHTFSTAKAAAIAAHRGGKCAAIASEEVALKYGLKVLAKDIQDNQYNLTKFVLIQKQNILDADCCKTSIVFSVDDKPGSLYKILSIFADAGINLTKIESRPMKRMLGQYMFFIDFEGSILDQGVKEILEKISSSCKFYKLLGSYPVYSQRN